MGLFRKVAAAATGLWGSHGPEGRGPASASRSGPRAPAAEIPLPLRVRHAAPGAGAAAMPESAPPPADLLENRVSKGLQAMEQRRLAALDQLKQVSAEWTQVQQARAAAKSRSAGSADTAVREVPIPPQRPPTLAQLFKEQDTRDATEPQAPPARKTVRFATQAEVRVTGSYGALAGPGRPVNLDPVTGSLLDKQPVRDPVPRPAPARPAHSEPGPNTAPAAAAPPPSQPLSAEEHRWLAQALPGGGRALRRLANRAARADLATRTGLRAQATRLVSPGPPRPLDGQRRQDFLALLGQDITALARHAQLDEASAAALLLRAVLSGAVGTAMHPDDQLLLLGLLERQAPQEAAAHMPWAPGALGDWWPTLPPAHQRAIEQAFEEQNDPTGAIWLAEARAGGAEAAQALHDHLIAHYRFEHDDRLHRIQPTDTGHARNHLGLMVQPGQPSAGEPSAEDLRGAALQAQLDRIHAANEAAKRKHRFLHGDPRPAEPAGPQRAGP